MRSAHPFAKRLVLSTIGAQRMTNYALKAASKEEFVALVTADQPEAPAYFAIDAQLNKAERPTLDSQLSRALVPIPFDRFGALAETAQVLDVREAEEFAAGHLPGSINIGLDGKFATWCGTLLDKETPIIVVASSGKEEEAIMRLGRIGFDNAIGYLADAESVLASTETRTFGRIDVEDLAANRERVLVDIRQPREYETSHIEGALSIPLNHIVERAGEIPRDREVVLICRTGYRSSIAASLLEPLGYDKLSDLRGGVVAWGAAGQPVTGEAPSCSASS